jgi:hypothetical protein
MLVSGRKFEGITIYSPETDYSVIVVPGRKCEGIT